MVVKIILELVLVSIWIVALFSLIKPDPFINLSLSELKWAMKSHGLDAEIKPTPKTKVIYRIWSVVMLLLTGCLMYLLYISNIF